MINARRKAFSLVEAIIAIVILGTAMLGLSAFYASSLVVTTRSLQDSDSLKVSYSQLVKVALKNRGDLDATGSSSPIRAVASVEPLEGYANLSLVTSDDRREDRGTVQLKRYNIGPDGDIRIYRENDSTT